MSSQFFKTTPEASGRTLAAVLRMHLPDHSWGKIRQLVSSRRVRIGGELCLDSARRLTEGETIELLGASAPKLPQEESVILRYVDEHLVVVEKPSGIPTTRHPAERQWSRRRKAMSPTLEDLVCSKLARKEKIPRTKFPRLRIVHRLDKHTSGLLTMARTVTAERGLGQQFKAHTVNRTYIAIVPGRIGHRCITSQFVRDRGDGRRGSTTDEGQGKTAVTHVDVLEKLAGFTVLRCRLDTGRTHQIRIHLAEAGHPVCGDAVYCRLPSGKMFEDKSGAPRLALHATELGFMHPVKKTALHFSMPLPRDLQEFLDRLRRRTQ